ncbi:hypothetical protein E4U42_000832 [Claviceps africana]|uniref:Uncharacterized protein n=1 Tax=Claviceps africana TaxID=83212 RepID=A0A8K0NKC5_9HYPO|nr:hypothetical protein E4U42_000832 [Claviceps africana]
MSTFDPRQPITDASVFCPRGMFVDNRNNSKRGKSGIFEEDGEDTEKAFILSSSDMKALNRFLGTGRLLQTTRAEYLRGLGIGDKPGEISAELGKELQLLVGTYGSIKRDCVQFKDVTWGRIKNLAAEIKICAAISGGKEATSYYVLMLQYMGQYHAENKKPNPDKDLLAELKEAITILVDTELEMINKLQTGAANAISELGAFGNVCSAHRNTIEINRTNLMAQLGKEGNDTKSMQEKIDAAKEDIMDLEAEIDAKNKLINEAPYYMWIRPIGTAVGTGIVVEAKKARKRLRESMRKIQDTLREYKDKMRTASILTTNLSTISSRVAALSTQIGPAIKTLQELQGSWKNMETDLKIIKELIEFDADNIPPMLTERPKLQGIVDEWNELKDYVSKHIEYSYLTGEPKQMSLDEYIEELS